MDARHDLDERALARTVLAHEGVDLARADFEVDAVERAGLPERLDRAADAEDRIEQGISSGGSAGASPRRLSRMMRQE